MTIRFNYNVDFLNNSEREPNKPANIGEIPPSGLGGRYC